MTVGVPFPRGLVHSVSQLSLATPDGGRAPLQATVLKLWPDGSARWALLDFQASLPPHTTATYEILVGESAEASEPVAGIALTERDDAIHVVTGDAEFRVDRRTGTLTLGGRHGVVGEPCEAVWRMQSAQGVAGEPRVRRTTIETRGPVRSTIRIEGEFPGCQFEQTLSFFAGSAVVRVAFTLRNPRRARHRGNVWDLGDPGSIYIRDLSLYASVARGTAGRTVWSVAPGEPFTGTVADLEIYQDSSGGPNWDSANHVNRHGRITTSFRGYRVRDGAVVSSGDRAQPLVAVYAGLGGVACAVQDFWQNFPKAIEVAQGTLIVRLFPGQYADVHELQGGEQKSHVIYLSSLDAGGALDEMAWARAPLTPHASPEWYAASGAIPYLVPEADDGDAGYGALVEAAIEGNDSFEQKREIADEYGWRHFGDLWADHEQVYYRGPAPVVSHYNNQYDAVHGFGVQFMRTGDPRWFRLMDDLAAHVADIDIYHTTADRACFNRGMFWHTNHYVTAGTSTHRTYSRLAGAQGGGPSNEHCYSTGLLAHYFLTGSPRSRQAVIGLAQWMIDMDDGRKTWLGVLSGGPTGAASCTNTPEYHGPGRGAGNAINTLLDAYAVTEDGRFLDKAEQLIRRCIHPADDVEARQLLDAERRWSYVVFLQALGRYLDEKLERGELDRMYAYARESLLRYARWMADREAPYLDRRETLQYPTETWAAAEIKKSDAFKFAAKYADDEWRATFLERSRFFFRTAITTLASFPTRGFTRPLVILLNGYMQAYFDLHPAEAAPAGNAGHDFGRPETFVTQRQKVRRRLMVGGLALAISIAAWMVVG